MGTWDQNIRNSHRHTVGRHLWILVDPDLLRVDGGVNFGLGSFQLQNSVFLAVRPGTKAPPTEDQLIPDVFL